eukprot:scaffold340488_cov35-Attheya_sp.AAC.2
MSNENENGAPADGELTADGGGAEERRCRMTASPQSPARKRPDHVQKHQYRRQSKTAATTRSKRASTC